MADDMVGQDGSGTDGAPVGVSPKGEPLFPEDTGTCPLVVRHAITALVKKRYIFAETDRVAWDGLMSAPELVRSRLADMLLGLRVDDVAGIAYSYQVQLEGGTVPNKVKSISYFNNLQSLLMTQLVTKYFSATAAGETLVWVEGDELREAMERMFEDMPDVALADSHMEQAIGAMVRNGYLCEVVDGRYQVMPIVGVVYGIDEIKGVLSRYGIADGDDAQADVRQ